MIKGLSYPSFKITPQGSWPPGIHNLYCSLSVFILLCGFFLRLVVWPTEYSRSDHMWPPLKATAACTMVSGIILREATHNVMRTFNQQPFREAQLERNWGLLPTVSMLYQTCEWAPFRSLSCSFSQALIERIAVSWDHEPEPSSQATPKPLIHRNWQ